MSLHRRDFLRTLGVAGLGAVVAPRAVVSWLPQQTPRRTAASVEGPGVATTAYMDALWDESVGLIRSPEGLPHPVRESSWTRSVSWRATTMVTPSAPAAIETVVSKQYNSPGAVFHGSFALRHRPAAAADGRDAVHRVRPELAPVHRHRPRDGRRALRQASSARSAPTRSSAIELAADGRARRPRPARLLEHRDHARVAARLHRQHEGGEALAKQVAARYRDAGALDEYNSPTYDGVALYALCASGARSHRRACSPSSATSSTTGCGATSRARTTQACGTCAARTAARTGWTCPRTPARSGSGSGASSATTARRSPTSRSRSSTPATCASARSSSCSTAAVPGGARRSLSSSAGRARACRRAGHVGGDVVAREGRDGWAAAPARPCASAAPQMHPATVHWARRVRSGCGAAPRSTPRLPKSASSTSRSRRPASRDRHHRRARPRPGAGHDTEWALPGSTWTCSARVPMSGPTPMEEASRSSTAGDPPARRHPDLMPTTAASEQLLAIGEPRRGPRAIMRS